MERFKVFLKSKGFVYILLALFSLTLACLSNNYDYDLFARLLVGEHFFVNGSIAYKDFVSYTPTHIWYDHEWGSSLIFYAFFKLWGPFGLILVQAITVFFTAFFIVKTQSLQPKHYPVSLTFMLAFLILFAHQNPSIVRCHMFSFLFFSMLLYFLEKTRLKNSNIIWWFPLITIIWNNIHGGVVSGLGFIFIYMVCALITKKPWRKYFYVLVISTPLLAINPYGIEYLNFLFTANTMNRTFITEWWHVFATRHALYYFPLLVFGLLAVFAAIFNSKTFRKSNLTKIAALLTTLYLGVIHVKLLSLMMIVVAALYYSDIMRLIGKNAIRTLEKFAYTAVFVFALFIPFCRVSTPRVDFIKFPIQSVEFLRLNKIDGNILTRFGMGSYVAYKLYPQNLIYMDGRYEEVYYNEEFDNLVNFEQSTGDWEKAIYGYPTQIIVMEKPSVTYNRLLEDKRWEEVYSGSITSVFLPAARAKALKGKLVYPPNDIRYYERNFFDTMEKFNGEES